MHKLLPSTLTELVLRVGVFGTFLGHGIYALMVKDAWIHLITYFGFSIDFATFVMPIIGIIDLIIATSILLYPLPATIIWATIWAFSTALVRYIAGESILEFIERSANWALPLVFYLYVKKTK